MGSFLGKAMDDSMKKQQEVMVKNQQEMLERQIQMQNYMREMQAAMMVSRARELFNWYGSFYAVVLFAGIVGAVKGKKAALIPALPLTWVTGYQYHMCYGNKMDLIKLEAEKILQKESNMYALPAKLPSISILDERRKESKE